MKRAIVLSFVLLSSCIPPEPTGIQNHGDTGKVRLHSTGLGRLPFTPATKPEWDIAAQKECDKYWPGTKAHFEEALGSRAITAWYSCL